MNRKEFTLSQIEKYYKSPEINSKIPDWVTLGKNVNIYESVFFGESGFGFEKIDDKWIHIPHSGKAIIGDDVEIFSSSFIARGTSDDDLTIIGDGTKIDYNCHIAHNVKIGKNCLIIAGTIIGGSVVIGDNCYLGIGCMIKNKVKIGNNVTIGMGAVVIRDVPDNVTVVGNPAKIIK